MKKIPDPKKMKRINKPVIDQNQTKIRITTYLDQDVLKTLKDVADESGSKYQTLLNNILRDYFFGQKKGLLSRITRLEKAVFKKTKLA